MNGFFEKEFITFWTKVAIAFIPAAILGLVFYGVTEDKLFNITTVSIALFVGGILILLLDRRDNKFKFDSIETLPYRTAFYISGS